MDRALKTRKGFRAVNASGHQTPDSEDEPNQAGGTPAEFREFEYAMWDTTQQNQQTVICSAPGHASEYLDLEAGYTKETPDLRKTHPCRNYAMACMIYVSNGIKPFADDCAGTRLAWARLVLAWARLLLTQTASSIKRFFIDRVNRLRQFENRYRRVVLAWPKLILSGVRISLLWTKGKLLTCCVLAGNGIKLLADYSLEKGPAWAKLLLEWLKVLVMTFLFWKLFLSGSTGSSEVQISQHVKIQL